MILTRDGKEVIAIYKRDGSEVDEVKDANGRLVYTSTREITGTLPLSFTSRGKPLTDYRISGNTMQDGTPTPDAPADVVGCGVRTGNLLEITDNIKTSTEWVLSPPIANKRYFEVYDITDAVPRGIISAKVFENFEPGYEPGMLVCAITPENTDTVDLEYRILNTNGIVIPRTFDTTSWDNVYLCVGYGNSFYNEAEKQQKIDELFNNWKIMLNTGSTAMPYEPYGYKLPISSGGANLVDNSKVTINAYLSDSNGSTGASAVSDITDYIDFNGKPFAISGVRKTSIMNPTARAVCFYNSNKTFIEGARYLPDVMSSPAIFSDFPAGAKYIRFSFDKAFENSIMLNLGSTALPYEPYVEPTETNIYLGEAQTTRKIKKLVLTGEESISKIGANAPYAYYVRAIQGKPINRALLICSHIPAVYNYQGENPAMIIDSTLTLLLMNVGKEVMELQPSGNTVEGLKEYLAAQYAAGTPVTVWYVLAEQETGIVNEPLMKISNYADTITKAQAGVTIPTVSGTNVLDMPSTVKPSDVYIKGKGIRAIT